MNEHWNGWLLHHPLALVIHQRISFLIPPLLYVTYVSPIVTYVTPIVTYVTYVIPIVTYVIPIVTYETPKAIIFTIYYLHYLPIQI